MNGASTWWILVGLGAFHGINPAMGWLFAVALGMQERRRTAVLKAMPAVALGHALSIASVAAAVVFLSRLAEPAVFRAGSALVLIAFGVYRLLARHRARVGMRVGFFDLVLWSFLMATAHGAGLMLVPAFLQLPFAPAVDTAPPQLVQSTIAAVIVHTSVMLAISTAAAMTVYEWVGVAFLRRGWVNLDLVWALALVATGLLLLLPRWAEFG